MSVVATEETSAPARTRISHGEYHRLAMYLTQYMQEHPKEKFNIRTLHELLLGNTKFELKASTVRSIAATCGLPLIRVPMPRGPRGTRGKYRTRKTAAVTRYGKSTIRDGVLAKALLELTQSLGYSFADKNTALYLEEMVAVTQQADLQLPLPGISS